MDELRIYHSAIPLTEVASLASISASPHPPGLDFTGGVPLWGPDRPVLRQKELPVLSNVRFSVVKPYEFGQDGFRYQHVPSIEWHKGRLHAVWTANRNAENTPGQIIAHRVSDDDGRSWSALGTVVEGDPACGAGFNEPVLFAHDERLWCFTGTASTPTQPKSPFGLSNGTRAFLFDERSGGWRYQGDISGGVRFWPLQRPLQLPCGEWLMAGMNVERNYGEGTYDLPAAFARSTNDDFTSWEIVDLPRPPGPQLGELALMALDSSRVLGVARYHPSMRNVALVVVSEDGGKNWTAQRESNLPMSQSKPNAGTLRSGHSYLIGNIASDSGGQRTPLTIALMRPGEDSFSRMAVIRHAEFPEGPGESHRQGRVHYPSSVEHEGYLYVIYCVDGVEGRAPGEGRLLWNNNSIELAVIPMESLML